MKPTILRCLVLAALLAVLSVAGSAQPGIPPPSAARMFAGESLVYDAKINKILHGISIAELTFSASALHGSDQLVIKSDAVSKGTLLKLFRYSFLQHYESTIDLDTFRILKTTKHDVQRERVRDSEAVFDYGEKRVTFMESDPKDNMRPPRRIASEIGEQVYDMISAIYAVRLLPLAVGKKFELSVSDSGLVYKLPFVVAARETQKSVLGKSSCFRIEPQIFGPGKLIEQEGSMVIWMTDDESHVPVRAEINSSYGKIDIKLKSQAKATAAARPKK